MANMEMIEAELKQYLEDSPNLSRQDRYVHLIAIFKKHFDMEKSEHQLTGSDFNSIMNYAKSSYAQTSLPMKITNREIYPSEVGSVLIVESVIGYLNRFKLLKRMVQIDYTR